MKTNVIGVLARGLLAATALVLAANAGAETPPDARTDRAALTMGRHKVSLTGATPHAGMKAECQEMMARKQEMHARLEAADATLDKLVAEMNAAKGSRDGALEKGMAAVLNELVAQRKTSRAMMMGMQPEMMGHMKHHMGTSDAKGEMDCPMMKAGDAPEARPAAMKHRM